MDVPVVGEEPDREAELLGNPDYTVAAPNNFTYYINGVYWYDMTDEPNPPVTQEEKLLAV